MHQVKLPFLFRPWSLCRLATTAVASLGHPSGCRIRKSSPCLVRQVLFAQACERVTTFSDSCSIAMTQMWAVIFAATSMMASLAMAASSPKCVAADPTVWNFDGELTLEAGQTAGVKCLVDGVPSVELITCPETSSTELRSNVIGYEVSCDGDDMGRMLAEASNATNTSTSTSSSSTTSSTTSSTSSSSTSSTTTYTMTNTTTMEENMTNVTEAPESDSNTTTTAAGGGSAVSSACTDSVLAAVGTAVLALAMQ